MSTERVDKPEEQVRREAIAALGANGEAFLLFAVQADGRVEFRGLIPERYPIRRVDSLLGSAMKHIVSMADQFFPRRKSPIVRPGDFDPKKVN